MSPTTARPRAALLATLVIAAAFAVLPTAALGSLPDKRVYEQVSPANKNGNEAGLDAGEARTQYSIATPDGNTLLYGATGAVGEAAGSALLQQPVVARRTPGKGWASVAALPRQVGPWEFFVNRLSTLVPSKNLSYVAFTNRGAYVAKGQPADLSLSPNIFLAGPGPAGAPAPDPFVEPAWLARPSIPNPIPALGEDTAQEGLGLVGNILPAGPPSETGRTYFGYSGTLVPEDASRAPNVGNGSGREPTIRMEEYFTATVHPWGFYEWNEGTLRNAGTLPSDSLYPGEPDPWGAEPSSLAGNPHQQGDNGLNLDVTPASFGNEVSSDGSRAFFVSPDPRSEHPANDPPELYVRKTAPDGTVEPVLVSQDALLPALNGLPAPAPAGVSGVLRPQRDFNEWAVTSFAYATPDGSRVFFASTDRLTGEAPSDASVKAYEFELEAQGGRGMVTYLPGVSGAILTVTADGSRVLFENTAASVPALELWQQSSQGAQTVTKIADLPTPSLTGTNRIEPCTGSSCRLLIPDAYVSADGSVFAFETDSPLAGGFNNGGGFEQIYRYEAPTQKLVCVSCPPQGVAPSGDAEMSNDSQINYKPGRWQDSRGLSEDGSRVFFDTPDPLVTQDVNGVRDVYEWENGHLFLVSDGVNFHPSLYLDSSTSGGDVFFATTVGLVPGDTDGGYDVYDARIPHPGDNPPPAAVPCEGEVCQGPPSVPALLGAPSSGTFSGLGNIVQSPEAKPSAKKSKQKPKHRRKVKRRKRKKAKKANGRGGR